MLKRKPGDDCKLFSVDKEFANFAVSALILDLPGESEAKAPELVEDEEKVKADEKPKLEGKAIIDHIFNKIKIFADSYVPKSIAKPEQTNEVEVKKEEDGFVEAVEVEDEFSEVKTKDDSSLKEEVISEVRPTGEKGDENVLVEVKGPVIEVPECPRKEEVKFAEDEEVIPLAEEDEEIPEEPMDLDIQEVDENGIPIFNSWARPKPPEPLPDIEKAAILSDEFKVKRAKQKEDILSRSWAALEKKEDAEESSETSASVSGVPLAGVDVCDIEDCFCKDPKIIPTALQSGQIDTQTPASSGTQTPVKPLEAKAANSSGKQDSSSKAVRSKLHKVRRALKSLGVKLYEFGEDQDDGEEVQGGPVEDCGKEFCRLGCICDSIASKPILPVHCGKMECMFRCSCDASVNALLTENVKTNVGISPVGAANLRYGVTIFCEFCHQILFKFW